MTAEACGRGLRMMIAVPIFTPGGRLERAKPPDVLAGIDALGKTRFEMQKTIHESLHMQAVNHSNGAEPEKPSPAKQEISKADRDCDKCGLKLGPNHVSRMHQIGAPLLHTGRLPLVKPSQVRPPEATVTRTGHIINRVGVCMMIAMICDPGTRGAGTVETRKENQNLLDHRMKFHRTMSQTAMVADCRSQAARACQKKRAQKYLPVRQREQYQSDTGQYMNGQDINQDPKVL